MNDINPYFALAINGFFTGLGVIVAQHTYELYFKNRLIGIHKKINNIANKINKQNGIKEKE